MASLRLVRKALDEVMDPELGRSITALGMVHDLVLHDGIVTFTLALTTMACPLRARMQDDARSRLLTLEGVHDVVINVRAMTATEREKVFGKPQSQTDGAASAHNSIKHVVAVLSGKGGVGKSSVAALLAIALRRKGLSVGLLDADITGPSIPKMLLPESERPGASPVGILPPVTRSGIKVISVNLFLDDPNQAVIWRGPLIAGAIKQFWGDVAWGDLDYMIVDLPPGTSDASLTVLQQIPLNGILLVSGPQSLSGMVVRKAASMAEQLNIPLLGLVENMSYADCPHCGERHEVFGPSNAVELSSSLRVPVLGRLPIVPEIARLGDAGRLEEYPGGEFSELADKLLAVVPDSACQPALH